MYTGKLGKFEWEFSHSHPKHWWLVLKHDGELKVWSELKLGSE